MEEIRATGKTVDDALTEALIQLGTTSDQVEYDVIEKGSSGFLGIGSKPAVIVVRKKTAVKTETVETKVEEKVKTVKNAETKVEKKLDKFEKKVEKKIEKAETKVEKKLQEVEQQVEKKLEKIEADVEETFTVKNEEMPSSEKVVKVPVNAEELEANVDTFLKDVFKAMNMEVEIKYEFEEASRTLSIELIGKDMGILIGKRGQTMDSMQYLISLIANKGSSEYVRIKLDTENYRKRRRATLENLAKNIAYKVKRERKPVTLEPMNPYERRIIHSALQNDRYVETHSEGKEPYRRVVVSLKKNN